MAKLAWNPVTRWAGEVHGGNTIAPQYVARKPYKPKIIGEKPAPIAAKKPAKGLSKWNTDIATPGTESMRKKGYILPELKTPKKASKFQDRNGMWGPVNIIKGLRAPALIEVGAPRSPVQEDSDFVMALIEATPAKTAKKPSFVEPQYEDQRPRRAMKKRIRGFFTPKYGNPYPNGQAPRLFTKSFFSDNQTKFKKTSLIEEESVFAELGSEVDEESSPAKNKKTAKPAYPTTKLTRKPTIVKKKAWYPKNVLVPTYTHVVVEPAQQVVTRPKYVRAERVFNLNDKMFSLLQKSDDVAVDVEYLPEPASEEEVAEETAQENEETSNALTAWDEAQEEAADDE